MQADKSPPVPALRVQIVPPGPGGVHDFAAALSAEWALQGHPSKLLAMDRTATRVQSLAGVLTTLRGGAQERCSLLVHFSGYGYDKRGLCGWLLHELRAAQQQWGSSLRIVTLFHELFASSTPWKSAFWLGPAQEDIARRLAALSAAVATNTSQHAQWLRAQPGLSAAVQARPVFSNFPQPALLPALAEREPALIVFGAVATRGRALQRLAAHASALHALGIEAVTEVGPGAPTALHPWPHQHLGLLPPAAVAQQLLRHRYALIDYPAAYLAKSSVLAAYAAHGCAVLNTAAAATDADGLRAGEHYAALGATRPLPQPVDTKAWQTMADDLNRWHSGHTLQLQAGELGALLDPLQAWPERN